MKVCIIGSAGHTNYVLDGVKEDNDIKIVAIAPGCNGEDIAGLEEKIKALGQKPKIFSDYRKMLFELRPDVVAVASKFYKQSTIIIDALKLGISVFAEKPLALTMSELDKIRDVYKKSDLHLAAMFGIRYKPWFMKAWNLVQEGAIGRVRIMNAQKSYKLGSREDFFKKRKTYGGTIPWVGSHAIDWLYWFSGEDFRRVYASHSSKFNQEHGELELTGLVHFDFSNEVMGMVNIDYLRPPTAPTHDDDRLRVAGTKGVIEVRQGKVYLINDEGEGIQEIQLRDNKGIFSDFLKQLKGEGKCLISAEDSFYVTEACLRARQSADENRVIEFSDSF